MIQSQIVVRPPREDEGLKFGEENKFVIPIDHFDYGLKLPLPWEILKVMDYYGFVFGRLPPNSIGLINVFINYLR